MFTPSFHFFVAHNGQCNLISFSCHNILKRRDNRQLEIRVSEPRIRRQLTLFISLPLSSVSNPRFFPAARIIDQPPPLCGETGLWRRSTGGGHFIGPEPNNLINIARLAPFSLFPVSLSPPSVFRL